MIGQFTDAEFKEICKNAPRYNVDYIKGTATVFYGKHTINYYYQHQDGSWTNYDCKTSYNYHWHHWL